MYGVEKGCPTHWTLLRFVLELLILKAKYGWSDSTFNGLLRLQKETVYGVVVWKGELFLREFGRVSLSLTKYPTEYSPNA